MASAWVKAQDRKRNLAAALSTACIYIIAFLGAWAIGLIAPQSLASMPGTVIVDLGGEGPGGEVPLGLPNAPDRPEGAPPGAAPVPAGGAEAASLPEPAPVEAATKAAAIPEPAKPAPTKAAPKAAPKTAPKATAPKAVAKAPAKTIPDQAAKTPEETAAEAAAAEAAASAAAERAAAEDAAVRAAAATAAAAAGPAKTKTFGAKAGSGSGGAPVTGSGTGSSPGVAGGTGSVTFRGSEMGSALTTTFGASSGQVGRNIYVPIYLYMPLPQSVSADVYRNITAKETFRSYYEQSGSDWKLKAQIAVSQRGEVWTMLEAAGFDASTADYKTSRKLSPVVLEFAVGPAAKNRAELVDVRLVTSSGSAEVDEAVLYGFRQASFFNKTGFAIGGKFIYGF
jgi:outer membrane biosynthesis protein TonB